MALVSSELRRNDYLMQVTRAARWTNFFDTLYEVEKSSVPFPDDPPIVYPAAPVWEELSNRRKERIRLDGFESHGRSGAAHRESAALTAACARASTSPKFR